MTEMLHGAQSAAPQPRQRWTEGVATAIPQGAEVSRLFDPEDPAYDIDLALFNREVRPPVPQGIVADPRTWWGPARPRPVQKWLVIPTWAREHRRQVRWQVDLDREEGEILSCDEG